MAGIRDPNSGGSTVLIAPGVRLTVHDRRTTYLSFGIPVLQNLNGIQHETDCRIVAGLGLELQENGPA